MLCKYCDWVKVISDVPMGRVCLMRAVDRATGLCHRMLYCISVVVMGPDLMRTMFLLLSI